MPVWPFLMGVTALLTAWGAYAGAWKVPALALLGYILMRGVVSLDAYQEIVACALWLFIAAGMVKIGGAIPGFFFALSALVYPALFIVGFRIEYMGLIAVLADGFAILALLSIGGGYLGMAHYSPDRDSGILAWIADHALGVAVRQKSADSGL